MRWRRAIRSVFTSEIRGRFALLFGLLLVLLVGYLMVRRLIEHICGVALKDALRDGDAVDFQRAGIRRDQARGRARLGPLRAAAPRAMSPTAPTDERWAL